MYYLIIQKDFYNSSMPHSFDLKIGIILDLENHLRIANNDLSKCKKPNDHKLIKNHVFKSIYASFIGLKLLDLGITQKDIDITLSINRIEPMDSIACMRWHIYCFLKFSKPELKTLTYIINPEWFEEIVWIRPTFKSL